MHEWADRLGDLTGEQVKRGLMDWDQDWPPNVETFRKACTNQQQGLSHNTAAYRRSKRALPKPKANPEVVRSELAKMREMVRRG